MSAGVSPPLPPGADRNRRSKTAEKILSSSRYLAVTQHHGTESKKVGEKGHSKVRAILGRPKQNAEKDTCFGFWETVSALKKKLIGNHFWRNMFTNTNVWVDKDPLCL